MGHAETLLLPTKGMEDAVGARDAKGKAPANKVQ